MKVERIAIASIHIDPANLRKHPERNVAGIAASLARFGQQRPILLDRDHIVRAGNGTVLAAMRLGWERIDCVRTELRGSEAVAYAIADNRLAELGEFEETALAETLRSLQSEGFELDAIGFQAAEVDALIARLGDSLLGDAVADPAAEWAGMPEFRNEDKQGVRQIIVHFDTHEDVAGFAGLIGQDLTDKTKSIWYPYKAPQPFGTVDEP